MNRDAEQTSSLGGERSKRRRTGTAKVSDLWLDFYDACLRLEPEHQPVVINFDPISRQSRCRVQCPYGRSCGNHGGPHIYERMLFKQKPGDLDRRRLLKHVRNKHPEIAARFDVAATQDEGHVTHQRSQEDSATVQLDRQVSTPLFCCGRDDILTGCSSQDADEALESSDEDSVCTEVRRLGGHAHF